MSLHSRFGLLARLLRCILLLGGFVLATPAGAGPTAATLVRDIAITDQGSDPRLLAEVNGVVFFSAVDRVHGRELWKTDGTLAGTSMVADIRPGPESGLSFNSQGVKAGSSLAFDADDGTHGDEPWISDGTTAGTALLLDVDPAGGSDPEEFTVVSGTLFFVADDGTHGTELWMSDLTGAGTSLVRDIVTGPTGSQPQYLVAAGSKLYFRANDLTDGAELWSSDGTEAGTTIAADLHTGASSSSPLKITAVGSTIFLTADDGTNGREPWIFDPGTGVATLLEVNPGSDSSFASDFTLVGDRVYFSAQDGVNDFELWRTDGTALGTERVEDLNPGVSGSHPQHLTPLDGKLLFVAYSTTSSDAALWMFDPGTPGGPEELLNLQDNATSLDILGKAGGLALVRATDSATGSELYSTDGTEAGTALVADLVPGPADGLPQPGLPLGSSLVLPAGGISEEVWITDGTEGGTEQISDVDPGTISSLPNPDCDAPGQQDPYCDNHFLDFLVVAGQLYFEALTAEHGHELWITDGTDDGTSLVKDIGPGDQDSYPGGFVELGDLVLFAANEPGTGRELWRTDGTEAGTSLLADLEAGTPSSNPFHPTQVGDLVFFSADTTDSGRELWRTDGTAEGTMLVKDIRTGTGDSDPDDLTPLGEILVFSAEADSVTGRELWVSDGTEAGTVLVEDIHPTDDSQPQDFFEFAGALYFEANDGVHGSELWKTQGTAETTTLVADLEPGSGGVDIGFLGVLGGELFLSIEVDVPARGVESFQRLIKLDPSGTVTTVVDMCSHSDDNCSENYQRPVITDDAVYYSLLKGDDAELWMTDGTPGNATMVADLNGADGAHPRMLSAVGRQLFFTAEDFGTGRELWVTDGTVAGTTLVDDIATGATSSNPSIVVPVDNRGLLAATTLDHSTEPWSVDGVCPSELDLRGRSLEGTLELSATRNIHVGGELSSAVDLTLYAEEGVRMDSGFSVTDGAILRALSTVVCP